MTETVIELTDSTFDVLIKMSQGNPGALTALYELMKLDNGLLSILKLDSMQIRGCLIWIGYSDHCKKDIHKFHDYIMQRNPAMLKEINDYRQYL